MRPVFCFIDDAAFELENFRQNAAPFFFPVGFVYGKTFPEVRRALEGKCPLCFLLDIYGSAPGETAVIPRPRLLEDLPADAPGMDDFWQGVEEAGDEAGNLLLRRIYARVESWQSAFGAACRELGQGRAYGLANLAQVREHYPWAAALGYSRKALFADAAAFLRAGGPKEFCKSPRGRMMGLSPWPPKGRLPN